MKREDIKAQIPGITDEQLKWIMDENGKDITAEQSKAGTTKTELETARQTIKDLQDAAKKFDGVDVKALQQQIADAQKKYDTDVAALRKDSAIDLALANAHARNGKAVKALLDLEKVEYKDGQLSGLSDQLEKLQKDEAWAFDTTQPKPTVKTGLEHQQPDPKAGGTLDDELKSLLHL